jgi:HEPN domain-containing protein
MGALSMATERFPPTDPRTWLRFAQNNLIEARTRTHADLEISAFHAQQAAAVFIVHGLVFSYVHDLARLLTQLERAGVAVPLAVRAAGQLSRYAAETRYPYAGDPVTESQYDVAVGIAETVVAWAIQEVQKHLFEEEIAPSD